MKILLSSSTGNDDHNNGSNDGNNNDKDKDYRNKETENSQVCADPKNPIFIFQWQSSARSIWTQDIVDKRSNSLIRKG